MPHPDRSRVSVPPSCTWRSLTLCCVLCLVVQPAAAADWFQPKGSLGSAGHQRYVPPLVNPLFNETPFITTEARPAWLHYRLPSNFLTGGGEIDVYALELRLALTERLGFIASKDGYADIDFAGVLPDETGFANISAGFKYALISDPVAGSILTVGAEYELPTGNLRTGGISLQGDGDGFVDLFVSGAQTLGKLGLQGNVGINLAVDDNHDSSLLHWSLHADYELVTGFYPLLELNGYSTVRDGKRTPVDFEGVDLVNFGSTDAGTVVTLGGGMRYRFTPHVQMGLGYESPISENEDIMDWKFYLDLVITY